MQLLYCHLMFPQCPCKIGTRFPLNPVRQPLLGFDHSSTGFSPLLAFTGLTGVWWIFLHACLCGGGAHTCMCMWRPDVHLICPSSGPFFLSERQHLPLAWNLPIWPVLSEAGPRSQDLLHAWLISAHPTPSLGVRLGGRECLLYATLRFSVHQQGLPLSSFSVHCLASPSRTFPVR